MQARVEALKKNGHKVIFYDLYKKVQSPAPGKEIADDAKLPSKIKKHCKKIASANGIVIVHPNC